MVLVESLILGVPVVAAQYPALCEIMTDKMQGMVARQEKEHLTACICRMVEDDGIGTDSEKLLIDQNINQKAYSQFLEAIN